MKELLAFKIARKKKQPNFLRQDSNQYKQFDGWRKPRGMHNKLRRRMRGHVHVPTIGFGSPRLVKFLSKSGLKAELVNNLSQLKKLDNKKHSIIIGKIGLKNKLELIKKCIELKFKVSNLKDPSKYLEEKNKFLSDKKKLKQEKLSKKELKKSELEKKAKEKEAKKEDKTDKKDTEAMIKNDMKKRLPGDKK
ncbi:MAG: eL32 family ribosomal protein [Candidatus Nanoarchaeia archaeon]|nr:eL32 family ribosomal protein [Candidatus Nanoarchaeia archaeon]